MSVQICNTHSSECRNLEKTWKKLSVLFFFFSLRIRNLIDWIIPCEINKFWIKIVQHLLLIFVKIGRFRGLNSHSFKKCPVKESYSFKKEYGAKKKFGQKVTPFTIFFSESKEMFAKIKFGTLCISHLKM